MLKPPCDDFSFASPALSLKKLMPKARKPGFAPLLLQLHVVAERRGLERGGHTGPLVAVLQYGAQVVPDPRHGRALEQGLQLVLREMDVLCVTIQRNDQAEACQKE